MLKIVLVEPEIPQNTGNIARTCAVCGASLYLVRPLGFEIGEKKLRRAGLDYWSSLDVKYFDTFDEVVDCAIKDEAKLILNTTHAKRSYCDIKYSMGDYIVFGKETAGLGKDLIEKYGEHAVRIPMKDEQRSLNLSNAAAIVCYEVLRQNAFPDMR